MTAPALDLDRAVLCLDCGVVFDLVERQCPRCGTALIYLLTMWLERKTTVDVASDRTRLHELSLTQTTPTLRYGLDLPPHDVAGAKDDGGRGLGSHAVARGDAWNRQGSQHE